MKKMWIKEIKYWIEILPINMSTVVSMITTADKRMKDI